MALLPWNAINLCDGYGGFSLALAPLGVRTVCRVERDSYAAAVLVERMEQARLDQCPVWDDLESFDGAAWRGRVHLVTAGFPCQPFSAAGSRLGLDDDRWLWPTVCRIIRDVEPGYVFLENVPGLVRAGLPEVLADLAVPGFDAEWGLYSAADVGAPHRRERIWVVAHRDSDERLVEAEQHVQHSNEPRHGNRASGTDVAHACSGRLDRRASVANGADDHIERNGAEDVGHTRGEGRPEVTRGPYSHEDAYGRQPHRDHVTDRADEDVWDAERPRREGRDRAELGLRELAFAGFPPGRDDIDGWAEWIDQGGPQPVLRRHTDGPPSGLADALHLGGNGLVPAAARQAFLQLMRRGGWLT